MACLDLREDGQTVHIRHHKIEQDERKVVRLGPAQEIQSRLPAGRTANRHPGARDRRFKKTALHRIIIDNEDCVGHNAPIFTSER